MHTRNAHAYKSDGTTASSRKQPTQMYRLHQKYRNIGYYKFKKCVIVLLAVTS